MKIQAAVFDLDGTLLDTLGDLADAANWVLREMGLPVHPEEAYRRFVGNGAKLLCQRMLPPERQDDRTAAQALELFNCRYQKHLFDRTAPYPGIPALLETLAARGIGLGVVSNKPDPFVRPIVERYFPGRFGAVSGPLEGRLKPDPAGVLRALGELGASPKRALYVGDSGVDMETARRGGLRSCGVLWGFRDEQELRESGAEFLISSPEELLKLVHSLDAEGKAVR